MRKCCRPKNLSIVTNLDKIQLKNALENMKVKFLLDNKNATYCSKQMRQFYGNKQTSPHHKF